MNKKDKLKEIIKFAIRKGYDWKTNHISTMEKWVVNACQVDDWHTLLFDHDFAKAVFGEEEWGYHTGYQEWCELKNAPPVDILEEMLFKMPIWQYHIQQAVVSKDPTDYYYEYIKEHDKN